MSNLAEINTILGPEAAADLTKIIADIKAAVSASFDGIIADKDAERDKLTSDHTALIADKDSAHEATITRIRVDADLALEKAIKDGESSYDQALQIGSDAVQKAKADADDAIGALKDALATLVAEKNDLSELSNSLIAKANSERDAARVELAATEARQDELATASAALADNLTTVAAQVKALAVEAGKKLADKQAEARIALIAAKEAELASLRSA